VSQAQPSAANPIYNRFRQPDERTRRYFAADPGVEFRGQVPLINADDPNQPQEFMDGMARVFNLADPQQAKDYNEVINKVARGIAILCREDVTFSEKTDNYVIYARWMERFYAMPDYTQKETNGAAQTQPTPNAPVAQISV